jgi:hypothetical protein
MDMLSNDRKSILLMNPVRVNWKLEKYKSDKDSINSVMNHQFMSVDWLSGEDHRVWDGVPFSVRRQFRGAFTRKVVNLYIKFRLLFDKPNGSPIDAFISMKDNFSDLQEVGVEPIRDVINRLERTKQDMALHEAKNAMYIAECENKMLAAGFNRYITEQDLIKFILKCKKGLVLDEIDYFRRFIPDPVVESIDLAESLQIFDNYYVLSFDPDRADNPYYTEEEKEDPIVFGVVINSDKLYYIADWIDEHCDLTYDKIVKVLNKDAHLIKQITDGSN